MDELESLSHTKWECKYHVVFIPKPRGTHQATRLFSVCRSALARAKVRRSVVPLKLPAVLDF
jgi:REP element-mobilizing transposase RayT